MTDDIQIKDGFLYGPWRKAVNRTGAEVRAILEARGEKMVTRQTGSVGSIHDHEVAKKAGMRGGVVAGTIHLDLFQPLMLKTFGQKWFENGTISVFYTYALLHGEELRAIVQSPPQNVEDVQVEVRLESKDGRLVARGTASIGDPEEKSYLQAMDIKSNPPEERRIFKDLKIGYEAPPEEAVTEFSELTKNADFFEEILNWNLGPSPWGNAVVPPSRTFFMSRITLPLLPQGIGFYGATEIRFVNGPVMADVPYEKKAKIIAVGVTSKTEYYWFESRLFNKENGALVAQILQMTRSMKAGSPLYPEL